MATREEIAAVSRRSEAYSIIETVRVIRRRKVNPDGMSRAALCRLLLSVADELRTEARAGDSRD